MGLHNFEYKNFEIDRIEELPGLINYNPNLRGFQVTIPFKERILPYIDVLSEDAELTGAVNTVVLQQGQLLGYNTDVEGFSYTLAQARAGHNMHSALIFGTGGAARAVSLVFHRTGIEYKLVSRDKAKGDLMYEELKSEDIRSTDLLVNATPIGMYPDIGSAPDIPYAGLDGNQMLIDLVYNPEKTLFLERGEAKGCTILNGITMLYRQAEKTWEIWKTYLEENP